MDATNHLEIGVVSSAVLELYILTANINFNRFTGVGIRIQTLPSKWDQ
jgi:hypothetical protein